ncbi:hypothetical protein F5887DRAFT_916974 [Amanita rubescens]|nr:hypothetical protein F5887DRAFT_916974 [Amanita rubescens]
MDKTPGKNAGEPNPHARFKLACKGVFPEGVTGVNQRQKEVTDSFALSTSLETIAMAHRNRWFTRQCTTQNQFSGVMIFLRARPKEYDAKDPRGRRNEIFEKLTKNGIGIICDFRGIPVKGMLPTQLEIFAEMLSRMEWYLFTSFALEVIGGQRRLHAHNAIQSVLLKEIKKLQTSGDDILPP